jgi:hypothetical protein
MQTVGRLWGNMCTDRYDGNTGRKQTRLAVKTGSKFLLYQVK